MERVKLSVHRVVDWVLRCGDIDSRYVDASTMQQGAAAHRKIQKAMTGDYRKEVSLSLDACFFRESEAGFTVVLGARAAPGGTWFANVLADVIYSDRSFSLRDVRLEQTTVV